MTPERLHTLAARGWRISRDGSTATAYLTWEDADEPESGWEIFVLHTAGHGCRFSLAPLASGLDERPLADARRLAEALAEAVELMETWRGDLPPDPDP